MKSENNCFTCKHRGSVVGSAHSCCNHPIVELPSMRQLLMLKLLSGVGSTNPTQLIITSNDTGESFSMQEWDEYGISKGWVIYPINFDPTWLKHCHMYESKSESSPSVEK